MTNKIEIDVSRSGLESARVYAENFYEGKRALEAEGFRIISIQENAALRMLEGPRSNISKEGNLVKEGFVYVSREELYLTKNSPFMMHTHKKDPANEDELTDKEVQIALKGSIRLPGKIEVLYGKSSPEPIVIPTKRFGDEPVTNFLFGHYARKFGKFLQRADGCELVFDLLPHEIYNNKRQVFSQLWFGGITRASRNEIVFSYGHSGKEGGVCRACDCYPLREGCVRGIKGNLEELAKI